MIGNYQVMQIQPCMRTNTTQLDEHSDRCLLATTVDNHYNVDR